MNEEQSKQKEAGINQDVSREWVAPELTSLHTGSTAGGPKLNVTLGELGSYHS
ncbi:MAG: hypothetical protein WC799_22135 [Desulfobacteraceae bacterium]|jgi:hypothetical protein